MARIEIDPNYSSPTFSRATAGTDLFKKEDVQALAAAMSTHDHTTGKGAVLAAGSIPAGSITSGMIADGTIVTGDIADGAVTSAKILDGTIQTADLAPGAVTQTIRAVGSTSSPTTTSASLVDLPEMSVTFQTQGGNVLVLGWCSIAGSGSALVLQLAASLDGVDSQVSQANTTAVSGNAQTMTYAYLFTPLSAGVHTFKLRWSTSVGTATALGVNRHMVAVEYIR